MRLKIFLGSGRWIVLLDVPVPQGIRGTSFVYFKATNVPINRVKYILAVHTLNHCLTRSYERRCVDYARNSGFVRKS